MIGISLLNRGSHRSGVGKKDAYRDVSDAGLNTSLPRCLHPHSINLVFYEFPEMPRLSAGFELRCFQLLSIGVWLPSIALPDNW